MKDGQNHHINARGIFCKVTIVFVGVLLAGCAGNQRHPVVGIVGPAPICDSSHPASNGSLIVFSAREPIANPVIPGSSDSPGGGDSGFTWEYSSYKILSPSGKVVEAVNNNEGRTAHPSQVELPAGNYVVKAEAEKYGPVTVLVVVANGQNTILNLDKPGYRPRDPRLNITNAVCFPDGRMIGWRADVRATSAE